VPAIVDLVGGQLGLIRCKPTPEAGGQTAAPEPEPQEDSPAVTGRCEDPGRGAVNGVATERATKARGVS